MLTKFIALTQAGTFSSLEHTHTHTHMHRAPHSHTHTFAPIIVEWSSISLSQQFAERASMETKKHLFKRRKQKWSFTKASNVNAKISLLASTYALHVYFLLIINVISQPHIITENLRV